MHRLLAFWRPVVTASWSLQEATTGVDPAPLRAFNLLCHAFAAAGIGLLARRLGAGAVGAVVAGGMAALFPEQGGTVTWVKTMRSLRTEALEASCPTPGTGSGRPPSSPTRSTLLWS